MIQPEFLKESVECVGCGSEADSAVWFLPHTEWPEASRYDQEIVLCLDCITVLLHKVTRHPVREKERYERFMGEIKETLRP